MVPPCIYEGSLDELLHEHGLDAVVDQLIDWLGKAASGTLIDLSQGWEPTRRDNCPSTAVFSAELLAAIAPKDGKVVNVLARYVTIGNGIYCQLESPMHPRMEATFSQQKSNTSNEPFSHGVLPAFIARASATNDQFPIFCTYQPDTVTNLPSLLELASSLGINGGAIQAELDSFYRAQVFGMADFNTWDKGLLALIILVVKRPAPLVGSDGRDEEVLPYVIRYDIDRYAPLKHDCQVHPAFHAHVVSPYLACAYIRVSTTRSPT